MVLVTTGVSAYAQSVPATPTMPQAPTMPQVPTMPAAPASPYQTYPAANVMQPMTPPTTTPPEGPKEPQKGDFDAGGQLKFPNGPDDTGKYATYNWISFDLHGRYNLLDALTVNATIPLAVHHPDMLMDGSQPKMIGGMNARFELMAPKLPSMPIFHYETTVGLVASVAYMHAKSMLLSDKDFPLFTGDYKVGATTGVIIKLKLSELLDFSLLPLWVHQANTGDALDALQVPLALIVKLGSLVKVSAELGVYTGDGFSLHARDDGRVQAGGALDLKLGPILVHAGAGAASLITGATGAYPSIRDSVYVDLNVKYAK
jgi:hypothetical protein